MGIFESWGRASKLQASAGRQSGTEREPRRLLNSELMELCCRVARSLLPQKSAAIWAEVHSQAAVPSPPHLACSVSSKKQANTTRPPPLPARRRLLAASN